MGDIILLSGYGLDTSAILGTDVLLGLDEYLSDCSALSDLNTDILDPLRDSSGTLRAVPLALNPPYLIYNKTLADSLGLDWDPLQLTWSEILDLGAQWHQEGQDLTLFGVMNSSSVDTLVSDMILVNLNVFQSTASAEQLAPLFETTKALIGDGQNFYRIPDAQFWWSPGFWDNTLFTPGINGADYENLFYNLSCAERDNDVELEIIPIPKGEDGSFRQSYADCFGISSRSEHPDQAWEFLQFALSGDGFAGDIYDSSYALWNRAADAQRYEAVEDHGIPLEPGKYQEYRALCDLPASRFSEPAGWIDAVWDRDGYRRRKLDPPGCKIKRPISFQGRKADIGRCDLCIFFPNYKLPDLSQSARDSHPAETPQFSDGTSLFPFIDIQVSAHYTGPGK